MPKEPTTAEIYKYLEKEAAQAQHEQHMRALISNLVRELAHEKSYSHAMKVLSVRTERFP
jgi:hypothetical protein